MASIYTPDATNTAQPADTDYAYLAAAELRTLKAYLAAQLAGLGGPVNASVFRNRNAIINGSMSVWQRGGTFTNQALTYAADRWIGNRAGNAGGQDISYISVAGSAFPGPYAMKWQRTAGNTSVAGMYQYYTIETIDSLPLAGKTVTLSFYAKAGANLSASGGLLTVNLVYGTGANQRVYAFTGATVAGSVAASLTTTPTRFSVTAAIPANATEVGLMFFWTPVGTAGADDSVVFSHVQLEQGAYATPFEIIPYAEELARCKRYYQALGPTILSGYQGAGGVFYGSWPLPVELRASTTPVFSSINYNNSSGLTMWLASAESMSIRITATAAGYCHAYFYATLDAEL
jgi:hypothetical protein